MNCRWLGDRVMAMWNVRQHPDRGTCLLGPQPCIPVSPDGGTDLENGEGHWRRIRMSAALVGGCPRPVDNSTGGSTYDHLISTVPLDN